MHDAIRAEAEFMPEFYDLDPMGIVWHGNYVKFFELGRCALLDKLDYGYARMEESGYAWPVVDMRIKFVRPLIHRQKARVEATLLEYENRMRIGFKIFDAATGACTTKGESIQMALEIRSREGCFVSPPCFVERVERLLATKGSERR